MRADFLQAAGVVIMGCSSVCAPRYAQAVEVRPEFEVASVKPAPPPGDNRIRVMMGGGPGTPDPGRVNFEFVNLRMVLARAYGVKSYQISGPGMLDSERFNITAKVPVGTSKEQFLVMLQNLVADRFKMTLHREKKELPAYALVVGKSGVKMKVAAEEEPVKDGGAPAPAMPPGRMPMGKDGFPDMPRGMGRGGMSVMMMPGRMRMMGDGTTMAGLCETLAQQLDRAVVDTTELTGKYDFALTFEPEQNRMMRGMPAGMGRGGSDGPPQNAPEVEAAPNLFTAVQEQLGLKLEPRKSLVELLVIDHLEKTPVEN
ncbi:MAG: hypothetical protein QOJ99_2644 [Bryobacterales bacterium]|nr:hypothetical protein [Bryobacterales bacterium]